jgi:hypothetical protein
MKSTDLLPRLAVLRERPLGPIGMFLERGKLGGSGLAKAIALVAEYTDELLDMLVACEEARDRLAALGFDDIIEALEHVHEIGTRAIDHHLAVPESAP